MRSIFR